MFGVDGDQFAAGEADEDLVDADTGGAHQRGEGVEELSAQIEAHRAHIEEEGTLSERRRRNLMNEVMALAAARLRRRLEESVRDDPSVKDLLDEVVARRLDPATAAGRLLERELPEF